MGWADGRRALVTGAGRGMGHATAERLLADGAGVIAVDVDGAGLADLEAAGAVTIVADLADTEARQRVIDEGRSGRLDFLVNAAAILHPRPFWEVTEADFRKVFAVNLESAWFLSLGLGRHLTEGGAIVNFSSPSARNAGTIEAAVYGATKTAIQSMTRSFAHALAPRRVRVNAVAPGITDTPMQAQVLEAVASIRGLERERLDEQRLGMVPLGRWASAAEMAGVIVWLLSDESAYITGQCLYVDGGYIMGA